MVASSKLLTLFIVPMFTGTISFVSSSSLMFCMLVYSQIKLKKVVRRILFMFCIYDIIYSLGSALAIFMIPNWTSEYALGNLTSCDINGAMIQVGFAGAALYTLSLSIYYVAIIKFNRKEKDISNKLLEYILHFIPNGFAIISGIFLAVKRQYGALLGNHVCWLGIHPRNCLFDPDVECERGGPMIMEYAKGFAIIPFMVIYALVFCAMVIVCHHIIKQKRKADRWRMQTEERDLSKLCCCFSQKPGGAMQEFTDEPASLLSQDTNKFLKIQQALRKTPNAPEDNTSVPFGASGSRTGPSKNPSASNVNQTPSLSQAQMKLLKMQQALRKKPNAPGDNKSIPSGASASRSGTSQDPLAFNVHQVKRKIRRESLLEHDAPIILSSNTSQDKPLRASRNSKKSRQELACSRDEKSAITHCILYLSSFLLCWILPLIARIYGLTGNPAPFQLILLGRIFTPLQGLFFILVYTRPHVKAIKNSNSELNWFQAFFIAFKAGGDNDFGDNRVSQLEAVDEEGIDAPRLRDSERVRRQEIVRQQFQRKSTVSSYKPSCVRSSLHTEGNNPNASDINDTMMVDGTMQESELERSNVSSKDDQDEVEDIQV